MIDTVEFVQWNVVPITGWENHNKSFHAELLGREMSEEDLERESQASHHHCQEGESEGRWWGVLVAGIAEISLTEAHVDLQDKISDYNPLSFSQPVDEKPFSNKVDVSIIYCLS